MGLLKKSAVASAILVPVLGLSGMYVANAETASDVASVTGSGSIAPGLTTGTCVAQTVTFTGTVTATPGSDDAGASGPITFSGNDICGNAQAGHGSGTISGAASGTVFYDRTGSSVTLTGSGLSVPGSTDPHSIHTGQCQFVPTNVNPTTAYTLTCQVVLDS